MANPYPLQPPLYQTCVSSAPPVNPEPNSIIIKIDEMSATLSRIETGTRSLHRGILTLGMMIGSLGVFIILTYPW